MATSTTQFWDVDGTPLQTYAYNIESLGDDRLSVSALRGTDLTIPGYPGDTFMPKMVASRKITLAMWVSGADVNGVVSGDQSAAFMQNWRTLRALLWTPNRQIVLTKRFYVGATLITASAKAQYAGGLLPSMHGPAGAAFTVDLQLADPYFYGPQVNSTLLTGSQVVNVLGDDVTRNIQFAINGARVNPKVHSNTMNVDVQYTGTLNAGDAVAISVPTFTSSTTPSGLASYNSVGSILHTGDPAWFLLTPGNNTIVLSSTSGIGVVTMTHQAAWL